MSEKVKYEFTDVKSLPVSTRISEYDTIIHDFMGRKVPFSKIVMVGLRTEYVVTYFKKRIKALNLKDVTVKTINKEVYFIRKLEVKAGKIPSA